MRSLSLPIAVTAFAAFSLLSAGAAELNLPDPLTLQNGDKVTTAATWQDKRRPEILAALAEGPRFLAA